MPYKSIEDRRAASRRHYAANRRKVIDRAADFNRAQRRVIRSLIVSLKESTPCTDCGLHYPYYVMQFDHVRGEKSFEVGASTRAGLSVASVQAEIAKCEIVCANCHAERTHQRGQYLPRILNAGASLQDALF